MTLSISESTNEALMGGVPMMTVTLPATKRFRRAPRGRRPLLPLRLGELLDLRVVQEELPPSLGERAEVEGGTAAGAGRALAGARVRGRLGGDRAPECLQGLELPGVRF